jgi:hypothetical protein
VLSPKTDYRQGLDWLIGYIRFTGNHNKLSDITDSMALRHVIFIYTHTHVYICVCVCVYIYIHIIFAINDIALCYSVVFIS